MRLELTPEELELRRATAAEVFATASGKAFISYLVDDLGFYDVPNTDSAMVLHNFALVFFVRYFEVMVDDASHRSLMTEAIIGVPKPHKETA